MKIMIAILLLFISITLNAQKPEVYDLKTDHLSNPIGLDNQVPALSWKTAFAGRNAMQIAYSIRVATSPDFGKTSIAWESGKKLSDQSLQVPFEGAALKSGTRYYWQVKIWDNKKGESSWSPVAYWETGILKSGDWKAKWIFPSHDTILYIPAISVRKDFEIKKNIASARVYITSLGLYELSLNGKRVSDQFLTPGWTSYDHRLQYQVFDVTSQLKTGSNAVGAMISNGWYRSNLGWENNWGIWGKKLGLLFQLHVRYTDGTDEFIISDGSWKSSTDGPIIMTGIYEGENYDARREIKGWNTPGFDHGKWLPVKEGNAPTARLIASESVPVKRIQELKPLKISRTPKGTLVADFGQNMVGWVRLKVSGPAGTTVVIRHAEVLDKYGEFYIDNLRGAETTMRYTLRGDGIETHEPHFTFFGFRYISIEGFPGDPKPENFTGIVVHSDMTVTGNFECSNPLLNQLQKNIQWGQKGNFVDIPTDCPQRDERLGWTGDAQVFSRTASFNMDVAAFFGKWLKDLAADQLNNGLVPPVIPNIMKKDIAGSAGWADAATIIPWEMYQVYGDQKFLEDQYPSMKAWVGYIESQSKNNLWASGYHFGDWLFYRPGDDLDGRSAVTDKYLIAQCFWANSTQLLIHAAKVLGKTEDVNHYSAKLQDIKEAFLKEYVTPGGRMVSGTQTAYVLALQFDMFPEELRTQAAQRLAENVKSYGNHLTTGFLGTPYLCFVLSRFGYHDIAYSLLLQESYPSWLFPVKMGATTIWERWDGQKPDSTFQSPGMNSFNHYAYGAVGDYLYRNVAGLNQESPGYKKVMITPTPDQRLGYAKATFESPYGRIESGWTRNGNNMVVSFTIPFNTTATIYLPGAKVNAVMDNGKRISDSKEFKNIQQEQTGVRLETGSGQYKLIYPIQ